MSVELRPTTERPTRLAHWLLAVLPVVRGCVRASLLATELCTGRHKQMTCHPCVGRSPM
jgi:hypothetical protein